MFFEKLYIRHEDGSYQLLLPSDDLVGVVTEKSGTVEHHHVMRLLDNKRFESAAKENVDTQGAYRSVVAVLVSKSTAEALDLP